MTFAWPANGDLRIVSSNDSINVYDSVDCVYNSSRSSLYFDSVLQCWRLQRQSTGTFYFLNAAENPLPGNGQYRLSLVDSGFQSIIKNWPAPCSMKLTEYGDNDMQISGRQFCMVSQAAEATTYTAYYSASPTSSTVAPSTSSPSFTGSSSSTSSKPTLSSGATALPQASELNIGAKAGIVIGVISAVVAFALFSWTLLLLRRKRQLAHPRPALTELSTSGGDESELSTTTHYHEKFAENDQNCTQFWYKPVVRPYTRAQELPVGSIRRELP